MESVAPSKPQASSSTKHKDRHIVSWTPQEDDMLREQVGIHGTENWTSTAAQFKDKTSRQCRRRWYTYLNTECKKGGWSPEEDMILCEAQKIFGNRWTEIAKVVSGRTDNAVKNRFNTLCKKRAKHDMLPKENKNPLVDLNTEGVMFHNGGIASVTSEPLAKKIRYQVSNLKENCDKNGNLQVQFGTDKEVSRPPLAVLGQNSISVGGLLTRLCNVNSAETCQNDDSKKVFPSSFLKRDDPKITALMQQAELLSSLAQKVNSDGSDQSFEDAWKELRDFLIQTGECGLLGSEISEIDFLLGDFKELIENLSNNIEDDPYMRQHDLVEDCQGKPGAACPLNLPDSKTEDHANECSINHGDLIDGPLEDEKCTTMTMPQVSTPCSKVKETHGTTSELPISEFSSPLQTVPLFQSFEEVIPSPKFSASERQFLLGLLCLPSPSSNTNSDPSQPSCKRALLHSL